MADISTKCLGLTLKSPIIVGSCGLTHSVAQIQRMEEYGAGAVVLKSIFEEDIAFEFQEVLDQASPGAYNLEAFDYYDYQIKEERLDRYIELIEGCKRVVSIPVIASVNCVYSHEWTFFAQRLEAAGADALELNMFFSPADSSRTREESEQVYFDIIDKVKNRVSIPVVLKISYYFTDLGPMIQRLSNTGVAGLVLFNRFFSPDFDIDKMEVTTTNVFSTPAEMALPLRWIAIMSERVSCDLIASTGVHDARAVIKQILAGAAAVQVVSALYKNGLEHLGAMVEELQNWMIRNEYYGLEQFRGAMSQQKNEEPGVYERFQFMRHFAGVV